MSKFGFLWCKDIEIPDIFVTNWTKVYFKRSGKNNAMVIGDLDDYCEKIVLSFRKLVKTCFKVEKIL